MKISQIITLLFAIIIIGSIETSKRDSRSTAEGKNAQKEQLSGPQSNSGQELN
ncbi:MAG: hypothetical protein WBL27_06955 [Salinimicrobium sp.]